MQTTSETWKSLWANGNAWLETKAVIAGVEYTDISAPVINRAAMQGGLGVGNAVSASLSLAVRTTDDIPKSAPVEILMRLTDGTTSSEWLPGGTFYISKRARDPVAGVQSFECYDALLKGNAALDEVPWTTENGEQITTEDDVPIMFNASYPRDMASLVTDIAIMLGVELDARTVINTGAEYVVSNPAAGSTIRDLLGTVAAAHGGNWIITPEGKLRLVPVISASGAAAATEDVADIVGTVGSIYVGDSAIISGVRYTAGEAEPVLIGDETGVIIDVNLPYALAHNLAQALIGTTYQPYTMSSAIYDPAAELGDYVRSGSDVASVLYSEAALLGPAFRGNIAAPEPSEIADEFPYIGASAKALTEAKAFAIEKATEITEALDESLNQEGIFNRLTDNGEVQGLYLYEGKVYLNASYIKSGTMVADFIQGGVIDGTTVKAKLLNIIDANGDTIASFNDTIRIGKTNDMYLVLDYNSLDLVPESPLFGKGFSIGDLRDNNKQATLYEERTGDGITKAFYLNAQFTSITIRINDAEVPPTSYYKEPGSANIVVFYTAPADGAIIYFEYVTTEPVYYYDFGSRVANSVVGKRSSVMGQELIASRFCAHAEGWLSSASGSASHAEGYGATTSGDYSHAECDRTTASGYASHSEGCKATASGSESHAEGSKTVASGQSSHAEGYGTIASGYISHAEGYYTKAAGAYQHVQGRYNIESSTNYVEIVGNGWGDDGRSNARTLTWSGNEWIAGSLTQGSDARLKDECGEVPDVSEIKAHRFRWNDNKPNHDDVEHIGYYAQDVEEVAPYLVSEDDSGHKALDYIGFLCAKIESLEKRISELERK